MKIVGREAIDEDKDSTLRDFMKEVRKENKGLQRVLKMLLWARGPGAEETLGEVSQTAQRKLGQRELEERSLEPEPGGRSGDTQLGSGHQEEEPRGSGWVREPWPAQLGFGAGHRSSELVAGVRIVQELGSAIGAGDSMGEQRNGENMQPFLLPRFER